MKYIRKIVFASVVFLVILGLALFINNKINISETMESYESLGAIPTGSEKLAALYSEYLCADEQLKDAVARLKGAENYLETRIQRFDKIRVAVPGSKSDAEIYEWDVIERLEEEVRERKIRKNDVEYAMRTLLRDTGKVDEALNRAASNHPEIKRIMERVNIVRELDAGFDFDSKSGNNFEITARWRILGTNGKVNRKDTMARFEQLKIQEDEVKETLKSKLWRLLIAWDGRYNLVQLAYEHIEKAEDTYLLAKVFYEEPTPRVEIGQLVKAYLAYLDASSGFGEHYRMFIQTDSILNEYFTQLGIEIPKGEAETKPAGRQ